MRPVLLRRRRIQSLYEMAPPHTCVHVDWAARRLLFCSWQEGRQYVSKKKEEARPPLPLVWKEMDVVSGRGALREEGGPIPMYEMVPSRTYSSSLRARRSYSLSQRVAGGASDSFSYSNTHALAH